MKLDKTKLRKPLLGLVVSAALITSVANHEGFRGQGYIPVPGDKVTYGHGFTTRPDGSPVQLTDKITVQESKQRLGKELLHYKNDISKCIKVPLTQYEAEAYTSLSFNIGVGAFCRSTLVKRLNAYDYEGACKEILKWDKFKGKPLRGLTVRRQQEYSLCIK